MSWMLLVFGPIIGITFDVMFKVYSNMFYPTQTQIHLEIESKEKAASKKRARAERKSSFRRRQGDGAALITETINLQRGTDVET